MKRILLPLIALLAVGTVGGYVWASTDHPHALVHHFDLRVRAMLERAHAPTPEPIIFKGPGKAKVTPNGVSIKFDVLTADGHHGKAIVRWDNPLEYRPNRPRFAGRGAARVILPHAEFAFRMRVKGLIMRADTGNLVIAGRFVSLCSSNDGAKFSGHFVGIE